MEEIKKIIAKAAYGQGTQTFSKSVHINTYEKKRPTEILGCIITDTEILSSTSEGNVANGKAVRVNGKFDVHIWYGLGGDTKVAKVGAKFSDIVMVYAKGAGKYSNEQVRAWIKQSPKCTGTTIIDEQEGVGVKAQVEYELGVEIIGQTTLNVKVINTVDEAEEPDDMPVDEEILDEYEDD